MSLDLIKKQKANIQKEKKKITASDYFRHPLAYQPLPKGREGATIEEINKNQNISTLDSFCSQKKNHNKAVCKDSSQKKDFKISPDKDAVNLFFSNMKPFVSGKKGGHVADVFRPNKASFAKNLRNSKPQSKNLSQPDCSYPGYNGKATLMVKVNTPPEKYTGGDGTELRDRLGDLEMDLPRYEDEDIYSPKSQESVQVSAPEPVSRLGRVQPARTNVRSDGVRRLEPIHGNDKIKTKSKLSTFDSRLRTNNGTTVKLSFVKPDFNVKLAVTPEPILETVAVEEEEEPIENDGITKSQYQIPGSSVILPALPVGRMTNSFVPKPIREVSAQLPETADLRGKSGRNIPINKPSDPAYDRIEEEEEQPFHFTRDYQPVHSFIEPIRPKKIPREKAPRHVMNRIKKTWKRIKEKNSAHREPKIINMEFHSGKSQYSPVNREYEPAESDVEFTPRIKKKPRSAWSKKLFTRNEEKVLENSLNYTKKLKNKFFIFRSENAKRSATILAVGVIVAMMIPIGAYVQKVIEAKSRIEAKSNNALNEVKSAKSAMLSAKPEQAQKNFETAYQDFLSASDSLDQVGGGMLSIIKVLPGGSKIASGQNILEAGKHLTSAGQIISEAFGLFLGDQGALKKRFISTDNLSNLKEATSFAPQAREDKAQTLTEAIIMFQDKLQKVKEELTVANDLLDKADIGDVPQDKRDSFIKLKDKLPEAIRGIDAFSEYSNTMLSLLGHNQSKQYLFLFQNNDELRATGGFIGTYGIMKISDGSINQLSIDGIYNPDGQLKERVIPPKPIQKMSATWSMHDANWWPDFPKSAEKVAWFYEKTGGPTVDGVVAFTPKIMEDLLRITGPINHGKYGVTVSADNFVELTQYKVEKDYDKQLNRPKQILADLAPLVLDKIFNSPPEKWVDVMNVFSQDLEERSIQMYFFDQNIQQQVSDLGWSGEILKTPKDYLSVVNTNISGQKTDKVIIQKIDHQSEIKPDGSIVDTVTITRTHNGGKEKYDWYNAVNSNWMRVYVPKGSELLHAEGYTREVDSPPVDYEKLGFVQDEMVVAEENGTNTDPYTGTRVYEDSDKTVFANWTYVSPGETLTVKYSYLLPFKLRFDDLKKPADTYSLLVQKQAGDENSTLSSEVTGLDAYDSIYHYPDNLSLPEWKFDEKFLKDFFAGVVLVPKGTKIDK